MLNLPTAWEFLLLSRRDSLIQPSGLRSVRLSIGAALSDGLTGRKCSDDRVDPHKLLPLQEGWYDFPLLLYTSQAVVLWQRCHVLHPWRFVSVSCFLSGFGVFKPRTAQPLCCRLRNSNHLCTSFILQLPRFPWKCTCIGVLIAQPSVFLAYFFSSMKNPYHTAEDFFFFLNFIACGESMLCSSSCSQPLTSSKTTSKIIYVHCFQPPVYHKANNHSHVWSTLSFVLVCDLLFGVKIEVGMKSPYDQVGGHGCLSLFN